MSEWALAVAAVGALAVGVAAEAVLSKRGVAPVWRAIIAIPVPWAIVVLVWSAMRAHT